MSADPARTVASTEDKWTLAQGSHDGRPMFLRLNQNFQHATDLAEYPVRMGVAIPLHQPNEHGLPVAAEGELLSNVEDELLRLLEGRALLVLVITTGGMREFVFHARDSDWIAGFHRDAAAAVTTHDVQVMAVRDPEWAVYRSFLPNA